jgi:hypothetical protein
MFWAKHLDKRPATGPAAADAAAAVIATVAVVADFAAAIITELA